MAAQHQRQVSTRLVPELMQVSVSHDSIKRLSEIPAFVSFAKDKMAQDNDFWHREAEFGEGIMRAAAIAVVEIGEG